jgi:Phage terminase, small subunit
VRLPRAPNENIEKAKELFDQGKKMVEISAALNVPEGTIRSWKKRYNWDCNVANKKRNVANKNNEKRVKRKTSVPEVESVVNNPDLTDKQRLFCLYYSKSFNATRSYQKAYGCSYETAMVEGHGHLRNPKIKDEIVHLKQERYVRSYISEEDIFQKYWDIAFADITDFLSFGRREVPVMGPFGPITIKDDNDVDDKTGAEAQ